MQYTFMTEKKSKIILPNNALNHQINDYIQHAGTQLMKQAFAEAKKRKCKHCGRKDKLKIVPLHEEPHPLPSRIVLFCDACKTNEELMSRDKSPQMKHYVKDIQKMLDRHSPAPEKDDDKVIKNSKVVDKLIKAKPKKN